MFTNLRFDLNILRYILFLKNDTLYLIYFVFLYACCCMKTYVPTFKYEVIFFKVLKQFKTLGGY